MNVIKSMGFITLILSVTSVHATYVSPSTASGAKTFDKQLLQNQYYNECLLTCSQSEDPNCPDNCKRLAKDKAKEVDSRR